MYASREVGRSRRQLSFTVDSEPSTCTLCLGHHRQFSTPATWKSKDAQALALSLNLSSDDLVCSACRKDITRVLADNAYTPRWEKAKERSKCNTCCITQCSQNVFASFSKARSDKLRCAFKTAGLKCTTLEIPTPTPLCKHHYHVVYNLVQPTQMHCVTCGTSLKHSNPKLCPNPEVIKKYLQENTD